MSIRFPVVLSALFFIGCAHNANQMQGSLGARVLPNGEIAIQPTNNGLVCERRSVTGSNIVERVCYDANEHEAQSEMERRRLLEEVNESSQRGIEQSIMREAGRSSR